MGKYFTLWDKTSDIYTPGVDKNGKGHWTAAEYIQQKAPWAANPNVKVIVSAGAINGGCFMEFEATKAAYKKMGANITDGMTDQQVLDAIDDFIDNPPPADPTAEERIAAAMEFQNAMSLV